MSLRCMSLDLVEAIKAQLGNSTEKVRLDFVRIRAMNMDGDVPGGRRRRRARLRGHGEEE